ncbi:MAG: hypothetical protein R2940_00780 [Syntrophotaleaceae bacterium]
MYKESFFVFLTLLITFLFIGSVHGNGLKIMVVVPEYHITHPDPQEDVQTEDNIVPIPDPAGETEIIKYLIQEGFQVVDQGVVEKIRYNEQIKAILNGDSDLAQRIGLEFGAEILIVGEAFSELATRNSFGGLTSCRARVEAKAILTESGVIIASEGTFSSGLDTAENIAGKKALQKAGKKVVGAMLTSLDSYR